MLSQLLGQDSKNKEINTKLLKIRGKSLIFADTMYAIPNLSVVEVGEIKRSIPLLFYILLAIGVYGLLSNSALLGLVALGLAGGLYYWLFVLNKRYGLRLVTNSGESSLIIWDDLKFLGQVAEVIYNVFNSEMVRDMNIHLDQRKITNVDQSDRSLHIGSMGDMVGSTVSTGNVQGGIFSGEPAAKPQPVKIAVTPDEPVAVEAAPKVAEEQVNVQR